MKNGICLFLCVMSFVFFTSFEAFAQEKKDLSKKEINKEFAFKDVALYNIGGNIMVYPLVNQKEGIKVRISGPAFLVNSIKMIEQKEEKRLLLTSSDALPDSSPWEIRVIDLVDITRPGMIGDFIYDSKTLSISISVPNSLIFPQSRLYLYE